MLRRTLFNRASRVPFLNPRAHFHGQPYSHPYGMGSGIPEFHATTILVVRRDGESVVIGDGQVTAGSMVVKNNAQKVRSISNGNVLVGIAGSAADCMTMIDRFELVLEEHPGQMLRAGVELAKNWRTDKYLRHLNAMMLCVDKNMSLTIDGTGNLFSNEDVAAIGSGGAYALSAAKALIDVPGLTAEEIGVKAMTIAADLCTNTNHNFVIKKIIDEDWKPPVADEEETEATNTDSSLSGV